MKSMIRVFGEKWTVPKRELRFSSLYNSEALYVPTTFDILGSKLVKIIQP